LFWELLNHVSVIMFGTRSTVNYGRGGVGIYQHATFGCPAYLVRTGDEIRQYLQVVNSKLLTSNDKRLVRRKIGMRRREALMSALHLVKRRHDVRKELMYLLRSDPLCAACWCVELSALLYIKLFRRPLPARFQF
jgi:hypothetical protein